MPSAYPLPLAFSRRHALLALLLFGIELLIGALLNDGFIRPFVGDVLVVMLIYCLIRTWIRLPAIPLASGVLLFATLVETGQYFHLADRLGVGHIPLARILIGSTFDPKDLLAYLAGTLITCTLSRFFPSGQRGDQTENKETP